MSNTIAKIVRREIDSARNRSGMQVGLPKVTIEASHAEYLCRMAERTAELEAALRVAERRIEGLKYMIDQAKTAEQKHELLMAIYSAYELLSQGNGMRALSVLSHTIDEENNDELS